jgi:16S rRNA processing protein RimM
LSSSSGHVTIGRAGRRHGLDGSFVVDEASDAPERFAVGNVILAEGSPAEIVASKRAGKRVVIRLDRPVSRGAILQIPRDALPPPDEDAYYVFQLVGLDVEEESGRVLGRVSEVVPGVANDVLALDTGLALPLVEAWIREVDLAAGRIVVADGSGDAD